MNYTEAVEYIESIPKFAKKNKPENTLELLRRIGRPERKMKVIHVAGTNGKGSVCAFLYSILIHAGKHTGLFTSPHLVEITERFQIDGAQVSHDQFTRAFLRVKQKVDEMVADGFYHPAYFELLFAAGLLMFEEAGVEYLVLETGLGGRLDATNLVERPVACVLTTISLDHMEYLGDTVAKIAGEKAGIIKEGVPVIYDGRNPESEQVILETARRMKAKAYRYDDTMREITGKTDKSIDFILKNRYDESHTPGEAPGVMAHRGGAGDDALQDAGAGDDASVQDADPGDDAAVQDADPGDGTVAWDADPRDDAALQDAGPGDDAAVWDAGPVPVASLYHDLQVMVPYLAEYQIVNSTLAMAALRVIDPEKTISDAQVAEGIAATRWQGRMETVLPDVVLDGAHNADGIREFIRTVRNVQERRKVSLLFSAVVEKEYEKMIRTICESIHPTSIVVTQVGGARVVPAGELAQVFRKYTDVPVTAKADVGEAFREALERKQDSILFCAGSLYLVGEIKGILLHNT